MARYQGRCRVLVSTIISFKIFAAKPCFNEDLGRRPVCKTVKSATALVETRVGVWGGSNLSLFFTPMGTSRGPRLRKTSRVPKTTTTGFGVRPETRVPASATAWWCELWASRRLSEPQSSRMKMGPQSHLPHELVKTAAETLMCLCQCPVHGRRPGIEQVVAVLTDPLRTRVSCPGKL